MLNGSIDSTLHALNGSRILDILAPGSTTFPSPLGYTDQYASAVADAPVFDPVPDALYIELDERFLFIRTASPLLQLHLSIVDRISFSEIHEMYEEDEAYEVSAISYSHLLLSDARPVHSCTRVRYWIDRHSIPSAALILGVEFQIDGGEKNLYMDAQNPFRFKVFTDPEDPNGAGLLTREREGLSARDWQARHGEIQERVWLPVEPPRSS